MGLWRKFFGGERPAETETPAEQPTQETTPAETETVTEEKPEEPAA